MNFVPGFSSVTNVMFFQGVDGKLYIWGSNEHSALGVGVDKVGEGVHELKFPPNPNGGDFKIRSVAMGLYHTLVLTEDYQVLSWGRDSTPTPQLFKHNTDSKIIQVACGAWFSAVLTEKGTVYSWGDNGDHQLGRDSTEGSYPVAVPLPSRVVKIAMGHSHGLALTEEGELYSWGRNGSGELGTGDWNPRNYPVKIPGIPKNTVSFFACTYHTMLLNTDGELLAWGWNGSGSLGIGDLSNICTPKIVGLKHVTQVACGGGQTMALLEDGSLYAWGYNDHYQVGDGTQLERSKPVKVLIDLPPGTWPVTIGCTNDASYFITNQHELYSWGIATCAQFKSNEEMSEDEEVKVPTKVELRVRLPTNVLWEVARWLFLGKGDEGSGFAVLPVEVLFHFVSLNK
jgi:alpha-tubulin suppressor-like RCC1 family protein